MKKKIPHRDDTARTLPQRKATKADAPKMRNRGVRGKMAVCRKCDTRSCLRALLPSDNGRPAGKTANRLAERAVPDAPLSAARIAAKICRRQTSAASRACRRWIFAPEF